MYWTLPVYVRMDETEAAFFLSLHLSLGSRGKTLSGTVTAVQWSQCSVRPWKRAELNTEHVVTLASSATCHVKPTETCRKADEYSWPTPQPVAWRYSDGVSPRLHERRNRMYEISGFRRSVKTGGDGASTSYETPNKFAVLSESDSDAEDTAVPTQTRDRKARIPPTVIYT